ncbi:MAG: DUF389 domain-containing protein [Micavibrio sp.]|nr:MAG: DUF389 domain-containing protein [Micavibrio sp.]
MPLRIVEISAPDAASDAIEDIAKDQGAIDSWHSAVNKDGRRTTSVLVHLDQQQGLMDEIQHKLHKEKKWRIAVLPVEATIPKPDVAKESEENGNGNGQGNNKAKKIVSGTITREELYTEMEKGARLDLNFMFFVIISALVAAIGLVRNDIAVIIGAMVIAPLLGPNLALAFGAALGDRDLMIGAVKTNGAGLALTLLISALIGFILPISLDSAELLSRTEVGLELIVLALASGAAGVLSVTTGMSGALVGVMVAVALMPPAVAMGLYIGDGAISNAYGASLILATNIICINLAAQSIFFLRGIKPRTWYARKKSKQSIKINGLFWLALLGIIVLLIVLRDYF